MTWYTDGINIDIPSVDVSTFSNGETLVSGLLGAGFVIGVAGVFYFIFSEERGLNKKHKLLRYKAVKGDSSKVGRVEKKTLDSIEKSKLYAFGSLALAALMGITGMFYVGNVIIGNQNYLVAEQNAIQSAVRNSIIKETGGYVESTESAKLPFKAGQKAKDIRIDGNRDGRMGVCKIGSTSSLEKKFTITFSCSKDFMSTEFPGVDINE